MRTLLMLAGASLLVGAAPALAKQNDKDKNHKAHAMSDAKGKNHKVHVMSNGYVDINRNGVADFRERFIDRNRNRVDDRVEARWNHGAGWCPPGLAKRNNGCVPPGQLKKDFREGQRVSRNYRYYTPYNDIPVDLRTHYNLDDDYRYIYRNNYIYAVDPQTNLVTRIISLLL